MVMATANQRIQNIHAFECLKEALIDEQVAITPASVVELVSSKRSSSSSSFKPPLFSKQTATEALDDLGATPVLVLVFASAHRPGGGVLKGAIAQEEDLSRQTTWYFNVKDCKAFFEKDHASALYSNLAVYVPDAYQVMDAKGDPITPKPIGMIGVAAPNLKGLMEQNNHREQSNVYTVLLDRVRALLEFAEQQQHPTLMLGAWGCGVFGLDPQKVADIFKQALGEGRFTGQTLFPIPDPAMYATFKKTFNPDWIPESETVAKSGLKV